MFIVLSLSFLRLKFDTPRLQILAMQAKPEPPCVPALYAFLLGSITTGSLLVAFLRLESSSPHMQPFAAYLGSLGLFHFLEYYWQAKYHPDTTTSEGKSEIGFIYLYCIFMYLLISLSVYHSIPFNIPRQHSC